MAQGTDLRPDAGLTAAQRRVVAQALAAVAKRYDCEAPAVLVDEFQFVMRVGTDVYSLAGLGVEGGPRVVAGVVRGLVGDVEGVSRGQLAAKLRSLAAEWSDDDNRPVIPRHPVPGPRRSDESGTVPAPRPAQSGESW